MKNFTLVNTEKYQIVLKVLDNSIAIYRKFLKEEHREIHLLNIKADKINSVKYAQTTDTIINGNKRTSIILGILSIVLFVIVGFAFKNLGNFSILLIIIGIILFVVGLANLPSKQIKAEQQFLLLDDKDQKIYSLNLQIDFKQFEEIVNEIRSIQK